MMQNTSFSNVHSGKLPLWAFVVFGITLLLGIGCTWLITLKLYTKSSEQVCNTLEKSLQTSQNYVLRDIEVSDRELQNKQYDPATKEKADIWKPKMDTAVGAMNRLCVYTDILKHKLKPGVGIETKEHKQLLDSIAVFSKTIISVIPEDKRESVGKLPIQQLLDSANYVDGWFQTFKQEKNLKIISALLTKLQFECVASAYIVADFCNLQTQYIDEDYDVFDVLIGQNAQQLMPNKILKITAGIGTYSSRAKPEIIVDGVKQDLNVNGFVVFEKRVNKSGSVPVSVSYKDPNTGELKKISTNVEYAVAKY